MRRLPVGYRLRGIGRGPQNHINPYFDYHIRDQRGRFTPGGSLLKEFCWNVDVFVCFFKSQICFGFKTWSNLDPNLV